MAERLSIQIKDEDNVAVAVHDLPAGTRNLLGIVTTVQCVAGVVKVAVERIKKELLPKYPNVGTEIFNLILDVASGTKQPYSDQYGFHNDMCIFNPAPIT